MATQQQYAQGMLAMRQALKVTNEARGYISGVRDRLQALDARNHAALTEFALGDDGDPGAAHAAALPELYELQQYLARWEAEKARVDATIAAAAPLLAALVGDYTPPAPEDLQ